MLYIDHVLFPVAPGKIEIETDVGNKVVELIDGSYVTALGGKMLRKISFDLLLPMSEYPFALYEGGFKTAGYYMDELSRIAEKNKPVWFDVYRTFPDMNKTYLTNMLVVPEKITLTEDATNGMDITARVVLREYRNVETKLAEEKLSQGYAEREGTLAVPYTYTVLEGDSLWRIAKKVFDDGEKYVYLAEINGIKKPYTIYTGQVIKLRE